LNEYLTKLCGKLYKLTKKKKQKTAKSNELVTRERGYLALPEEHAGAGARLPVVAGPVVRHHGPLLRLLNSSMAGHSHSPQVVVPSVLLVLQINYKAHRSITGGGGGAVAHQRHEVVALVVGEEPFVHEDPAYLCRSMCRNENQPRQNNACVCDVCPRSSYYVFIDVAVYIPWLP